MKNVKILSLLSIFLITSCNGGNADNSSLILNSSSSTNIEYPTLLEAINNSKYYAIAHKDQSEGFYYEISLDNFYYLDSKSQGIMIPDFDKDYYYSVETQRYVEDDYFKIKMVLHGKIAPSSEFSSVTNERLIDTLLAYADDFYQVNSYTWGCTTIELSDYFRDFFQTKSYSYTNYFELTVNEEGRLNSLGIYEKDEKNKYEIGLYNFYDFKLENYEPYIKWVEEGKKIQLRTYDLKVGYFDENEVYHSPYQDENVEFEGIVSAIDTYNNIYISQENSDTGNIAIKVELADKSSLPAINDNVKINGKINMDNYVSYICDGTYAKLGTAEYTPIFTEERIVDANGGGIYGANYFSQSPYYSDSVYSTYAYAESYPDTLNENEDTLVDFICPSFKSIDGDCFHMQLIIPNNLSLSKKTEIFNTIKSYGKYSENNANNTELSLDNVLIKFDMNYEYVVKLLVTESSIISKHLNASEKVEKYIGVSNFPAIENVSTTSYRFGGSSKMYIEENFNIETQDTEGIYICFINIDEEKYNNYINSLTNIGFNKIDEVKDIISGRHELYSYGSNIYLDLQYSLDYQNDVYTIQLWIYQGELIRLPYIEETLAKELPFLDEFYKLENTYDADYTHFKLLNFAGNDFSVENPLHCITLDLNEDRFAEYNQLVMSNGFSLFRDETNKDSNGKPLPYTYKTRGSSHSVYHKNGVFIDLALYPTTDYTYSGHNDYQWRIEILIYQADSPISTKYEENLDGFINSIAKINEEFRFDVDLPEDCKIEWLKSSGTYEFLEYGYYHQHELFIYYDDVETLYSIFVAGLEKSGYLANGQGKKSVIFSKMTDDNQYSYITLMKDVDRGFLRVMDGVGGVDF